LGLWQRNRAYEAIAPNKKPVTQTANITPSRPIDSTQTPAEDNANLQTQPTPTATAEPASILIPQSPVYVVAKSAIPSDQFQNLWNTLKLTIQNKTGVLGVNKGDGSVCFSMTGATLDLLPLPNWNVTLYTINPKNPNVESDAFKNCANVVCEVLGLDPAQKPSASAGSNHTQIKTMSKFGPVTVIRDPSGANTWMVRPVPTPTKPAYSPNVIAPPPTPIPTPAPKVP
jgi:hypothetical protein